MTALSHGVVSWRFFLGVALLFSRIAVSNAEDKKPLRRPWLHGHPTALPLLSKQRVSHDTDLYKFSLSPNDDGEEEDYEENTLGIGICSCLLVSPPNNRAITRPYSPVSSRHERDCFSLLVKRYKDGAMSQEWARLTPGDNFLFWQISKNIKKQYPFGNPSTILMLAAGTGITPMFQALQRLFGADEADSSNLETKVVLLFGCRTMSDIYLKMELEAMQERFPNRLSIVYPISSSASSPHESSTVKGRIDKDLIHRVCAAHGIDARNSAQAWVCGPPSFYNDLCGPREETQLSGALRELGFTNEQVIKF